MRPPEEFHNTQCEEWSGHPPYGRVTKTTFPSNAFETYGYDADNNLTSKTDRNSNTIDYVYDALNRLTEKDYPDTTKVEYTYDLVGKLMGVTDPSGTYGFTYDNMDRLTGTTAQYSFPRLRRSRMLTCPQIPRSRSYDAFLADEPVLVFVFWVGRG